MKYDGRTSAAQVKMSPPYYWGFIYSLEEKSTLFGDSKNSYTPEGKYYFGGGWLPEGSQIYVQLITQGVAAGTELYWKSTRLNSSQKSVV